MERKRIYYYGKLRFEGEYNNMRKWNGKGKEYDNNCELKFEGEYLNEERNGKGTQYFDGMVYFEGEFKNGKFWNGIF